MLSPSHISLRSVTSCFNSAITKELVAACHKGHPDLVQITTKIQVKLSTHTYMSFIHQTYLELMKLCIFAL